MKQAWIALLALAASSAVAQEPAETEDVARAEAPANQAFDLSGLVRVMDSASGGADDRSVRRALNAEERAAGLLRTHLAQCWRQPDAIDRRTRVTVSFTLDRDGQLMGEPRLLYASGPHRAQTRALRQSAIDAIRSCGPFPMATDPFLADRYDVWREVEAVFAPE
ncbi:MAG TPA: cell envelope integrity protein TolA [Vitreimonas sp.]|uniref:cell envelope integrity protein TolA n=1 Tax=Vitreimonas sp. TaxID=3069702 RepID=UPI002D28F206|nr:cell envelope integrity protein TolA [Vitreimonas sp.]HYD87042.1 cell envelope integrity protein TolA [Vitreimonas sp.]